MPTNAPSSPWIMLPCIFLSLFTTCLLVRAFPVTSSGGLLTVTKAAIAFLIILVATSSAVKKYICSAPNASLHPRQKPASHAISEFNIRTLDRINEWRNDVDGATENPNSFISTRGEVWVDEKARAKKRNKEREEQKKAKKALKEKFLVKRTELLGGRKEVVVEVLRED